MLDLCFELALSRGTGLILNRRLEMMFGVLQTFRRVRPAKQAQSGPGTKPTYACQAGQEE
eukprot:COSAG04_NODE_61_length_30104_cov_10.610932_9_plen_60_part_00